MKTIRRLNIEEKCGYYFMNMTNVNDFDTNLLIINEIAVFISRSTMYEISCDKESNTPYIAFSDIECTFRKSGQNKYLVFCETEKNKTILKNYGKIIDELRDQILFITEEDSFVMSKDFTRIKFKTSDDLPFNKKVNVLVCVISLYSLFEDNRYIIHKLYYMIVFMNMKIVVVTVNVIFFNKLWPLKQKQKNIDCVLERTCTRKDKILVIKLLEQKFIAD